MMSTLLDREPVSLFCFHGFTLDTQRRGLYQDGARVHLTPKPLEVLIYLVRNRGRVVEKRELLDAVWDGVFVTEDNLVQAVKEIRRALGDRKEDSRFIQTVPRHGYRFIAEVALEEEPLKFPLPAPKHAVNTLHDIHPVERNRKLGSRFVLAGLCIGALFIVVGLAVWFGLRKGLLRSAPVKPTPFANLKLTRITTSGKVTGAAISPDGNYVVYALSDEAQESLWLKQLASASDVQISQPEEIQHHALTFSPDTNSVYYVVRNENKLGELFQTPIFGGVPKKIVADIDSVITFSADGKQIAFFRGYPEKGESKLVIANADGSQEKEIAARKRPESFPTQLDAAPSWSPAAPVIMCPVANGGSAEGRMTVVSVDPNTGTISPFTPQRWWQVGHVTWLRDGSGLIITAKQRPADPSQIWYVSYPNGEARPITSDLNDYAGVTLTHENPPAILTLQSNVLSSVTIAPDQGSGVNIPVGTIEGGPGLAWTPRGQVVYTTRSKGNQDLYVMDADGNNRKQLTADAGDNRWPSVSPDGRYIVFMSDRTGANAIWRIGLDGSNPTPLTSGKDARSPRITPDGESIVYASLSNPWGLYKISIDGGDSLQLTNTAPTYVAISPDGKLIATGFREVAGADKTAIYRSEGGAPQRVLDFVSFYMLWKPDAQELTYVDQYNRNILSRPLAGGPTRQLTHFTDGHIRGFDWSRDGRLACSRSVTISDAIVLRSVP